MNASHSALRISHSALDTPDFALGTPHFALRTPHSTLRNPHSFDATGALMGGARAGAITLALVAGLVIAGIISFAWRLR
jgi:hypothetical protein